MTRGNGRRGPLEQLFGNSAKRLAEAVRAQETIVLIGAGLWECADLIQLLGKWIPEDRKVIVLENRADWSGVQEDELPKNHVMLHYDTSGANGVSLEDIARTALNMASDYLILPDLDWSDYDTFQQHIAPKFEGVIVGVEHLTDSKFRPIADIMIDLVVRHAAPPLGIRSVWARRIYPLEAIPAQGAGPHFVISPAGQISQAPVSVVDVTGNDIRRIQQFLSLVRQSADDLSARLNPNDNAFTELVRDLTHYRNAISRPASEIDWGLVWGLGVRLEETAAAAERQISNRLAPALEDAGLAALQSLRALHAPLILATVEGRELQEQADRLRMTREEQAALQADAVALSVNLNQNKETIIEPDAVAIVEAAAAGIGEGRHPERGTAFGIAAIKNMSTVLIGAVVVAAPRHFIGGIVGDGLTLGAWEVMKTSRIFAAAIAALGETSTVLLESAGAGAQELLIRLEPFPHFLRANEPILRRIANTLHMRWLLTYLDIVRIETSDDGSPQQD